MQCILFYGIFIYCQTSRLKPYHIKIIILKNSLEYYLNINPLNMIFKQPFFAYYDEII